jgi:hypothetical protein
MQATSSADIEIAVDPSTQYALQILSTGADGNPNGTLTGGDTQGLTTTNTGNLTLQGPFITTDEPLFGFIAQMNGGNAASTSDGENGGNGGVAGRTLSQIVSVTNSGGISINLPGALVGGGAALAGWSQGGMGAATSGHHNPAGAGGQSSGVTIVNTGKISVNLSGTGQFAGIQAYSRGGTAADQYDGGENNGGGAGSVMVENSGNITLNWKWADGVDAQSGIYGILAQSQSGDGGNSLINGLGNGGSAGIGLAQDLSARVTLLSGGDVTVSQVGTPPAAGAGVAALVIGGNGGNGLADEDDTAGGNGGNAGSTNESEAALQISATDASVLTSGSQLSAIRILAQAGNGAGTFNSGSYHDRNGGLGGNAGNASISVSTMNSLLKLSTAGDHSSAIETLQQGGSGGAGGYYGGDALGLGSSNAGNGGKGGDVGGLAIALNGSSALPISITTSANDSHGIYAVLEGGQGGDGGQLTGTIGGGSGGNGGNGGSTGAMTLAIKGTSISTSGSGAFGILAQSRANNGGAGGAGETTIAMGGDGGNGGSTGPLTITADSNTSVSTQGQGAVGIAGQTASGSGGEGGNANGQFSGSQGDGGSGGPAGAVNITNGGRISTSGADALGILAQSLAGGGGGGAASYGIFFSKGGSGGSSGSAGTVAVTNSGTISTEGTLALGVLAQSIGGSGGVAGSASGLTVALGGDSASNPFQSNASSVTINASGTVATAGLSAIGILAQSVGGGGGTGGASQGFVSIGGTGGKGGSGSIVSGVFQDLTVSTSGDNAHGVVAQSIGGGGGNAGNADSLGLFTSVAIGQSAGDGGAAGPVVVNLNNTDILTGGSKSAGIVGQSIGGGGGTGGQAFGYSIGPAVSVSVALGGTGGSGGDSGAVSSQLLGGRIKTGQTPQLISASCPSSPCAGMNQLPVDSFGAVIQSIGGGGGMGGNATAKAAAVAIPVDTSGDQISVPVAVSVGASGGIAGQSSYVTFAAAQGAQIETRGQGSHGVLIQSIGGGGGAGGDSSSLAAALGYGTSVPDGATSLTIETSVAVGASGAAGGDANSVWSALGGTINVSGGQATFTADAAGTAQSTIATYGDYANGITAQSIGGGGGNAGWGSGNTQAFGTGTVLSANIGVGGSGSGGGNGGQVQIEVLPAGMIQTAGSGAIGVLAQSIGGGGGTSQGGSYNFIGLAKHSEPNVTVKVGKTGGGGGAGGSVGVTVAGSIATYGGDAPAVQAQSIGGGGGQGGSAGSDASADNPILSVLEGRVDTKDIVQDAYKKLLGEAPPNYQLNLNLGISVGGAGGAGDSGGSVAVALNPTGSIATGGDWSTGIFAQSIGGGGGKGGGAFATGTGWLDPTHVDLNANYSVGGAGGVGSDGGSVSTSLNGGSIVTAGFGSAGVFAQSVGGGGGHAADGSDGFYGTLAVGIGYGGSGGASGSGGAVTLTTTASSSSNVATVTTRGEAAFGAVLQSIGGSGGFAGAGTSVRVAVADDPIPPIHLTSGSAQNTSAGNGGTVTLQDNGGIHIATAGNNAFGVFAQSVGGGGGIVINSQSQLANVSSINTSIFGSNPEQGAQANGGAVNVTVAHQSQIATSGTGAHGVVAQSVGGGGGLIGLPSTSPALTSDVRQGGTLTSGSGAGGDVSVTHNGAITVSGTGAVGILAQSVSGGGGLKLASDGNTVFAGSGISEYLSNATVTVAVTNNATVFATGANGIGVFAQNANGNGASVNIDGRVYGGTAAAPGIGVWVDSAVDSTLTIGSTGVVDADRAIVSTSGKLTTANNGIVSGSVNMSGGAMTNQGTYAAGSYFEGATLSNSGLVALGGREGTAFGYDRTEFASSTFNTSYTQTSSGTLQVGADFNSLTSDFLTVNGSATLDGVILIAPRALLPNRELAVLAVNGVQSGFVTASDSPVIDYEARLLGNTTRVRAVAANFGAPSMQLNRNASRLAQHLQRDWDQGGSAALAGLYAVLDTDSRQGASSYRNRLMDLSPGVSLAPAAQMQLGMSRFTNSMMSCPVFTGETAIAREQDCVWGQITGRHTLQKGAGDVSGFSLDSVTYQLGGQKRIAPNWYFGGSFAYQNAYLKGDDHRVTGSGSLGYAGVVLKHEAGPWTFSGAVGGGYGTYDITRTLSVPSYQSQAESTPGVYSLATRMRIARTFVEGNLYVKPYVDLDATYSRMPRYHESGDPLHLKVDSSDQFVFGLAPSVEVGGRKELTRGAVLRPYAYLGASLLSQKGWRTKSRLEGASGSTPSFTTELPGENVVGRVGAGLQVMHANGLDFKLQYDGEFTSKGSSHSGSLKLGYAF